MTVAILGRRLPATAAYAGALAIAFTLLLFVVGAAFWAADRQRVHNEAVRESFEIRADMRNALIALEDAETGQRGYLLTNDPDYLQPYNAGSAATHRWLDALARLAIREERLRADVARLRTLANEKLAELEQTVSDQQAHHHDRAVSVLRTGRGKLVMDEARALIDRVLENEGNLLNAHLAAAEHGADLLRLIVLLAAVMLVAIALLIIVTARQGMEELRLSRDDARQAHVVLMAETERRRATEAKMLHMQKMEAIGQLTGGVAHDFNNMLAVIIGAISLLQRRLARGDVEEAQRLSESALDGAKRAATLTSRLLGFARRAPLSPAVIDANKMVSGMSELLRRALGEQIHTETVLAGGLWKTYADAGQLENAIVNICVNARDAMENGGRLTIETSNASLDEHYAAANLDVSAGQYVQIAITDTGKGMPPDVIARVFEPFFTTKEVGRGTGLGLSHVHGFLKQTGGHVAIYSELGQGTTVKLYLPRTRRAEATATEAAPRAAPQGDSGTLILVVEDDDRVRALSVAALRDMGYSVVHASNGGEALRILAEKPGVKLLFTDIVMPGQSGRQLADAARARDPNLKVLYTTGYTANAIVHNGVIDADARLIMKPYSLDDLARKVRAALDET